MNTRRLAALPFFVLAAGCSRQPEPEPAPSASLAATVSATITAPSPAPRSSAAAPVSTAIAKAMQGRFGLGPADCTTTRGDDKGLLTISDKGLKFYESFARLAEPSENTPNRVVGRFAYQGEGMEWTRKASLDLKDNGKTLVLEEFGDDAVPGPQTYTRCPA